MCRLKVVQKSKYLEIVPRYTVRAKYVPVNVNRLLILDYFRSVSLSIGKNDNWRMWGRLGSMSG